MSYEYVLIGNQIFCAFTASFVSPTDAGYLAWCNDGNTAIGVTGNDAIVFQVQHLEMQQTPRRLREAANGTDNGWMKNLDSQITALRAQLQSPTTASQPVASS